jgi:hypothetical protein
MRRFLGLAVLVTALTVAVPAGASAVSCGDTITQSTTLTQDVVCPSSIQTAIRFDPSSPNPISLDLNHHTVVGRIQGGDRFDVLQGDAEVSNGTVIGNVLLAWAPTASAHDLRVESGVIGMNVTTGTVYRNRVTDSPFFGIGVSHGFYEVFDNQVTDSALDGIDIDLARAILTRNHSDRNRLLGIYGPFFAIDGGKNKARHNGDPRECVGVVCKP